MPGSLVPSGCGAFLGVVQQPSYSSKYMPATEHVRGLHSEGCTERFVANTAMSSGNVRSSPKVAAASPNSKRRALYSLA